MQQFLNHRIENVLYEVSSQQEISDLSKNIDELLVQLKPLLDQKIRAEISEKMQDLVIDYQQVVLQKLYVEAFIDGLNFEKKLKGVLENA